MLLKAIGRVFGGIIALFTGKTNKIADNLNENPDVRAARYGKILNEKNQRFQEVKGSVASLMGINKGKVVKLKDLNTRIEKHERLKAGAKAKAQECVNELKGAGKSQEEIQADINYVKYKKAYADFVSTLNEMEASADEYEQDIENGENTIKKYTLQLEQLQREIAKIKVEAQTDKVDVIMAQQQKEINDALAGISEDNTEKELEELRSSREKIKANAEISSELAGTNSAAQEAEFLEFAATSEIDDEFDAMLFDDEPTKKESASADTSLDSEFLPED